MVLAILDARYRTAFVLFIIAGLTDGLDGLLARTLHQQTVLGRYLDPVADKLLLSTLFLVLTHVGLISWRITVLVFARDLGILIVSAILYVSLGERDFHPSLPGKANTLAQILALVAVLLGCFYVADWVATLRRTALAATVALTILSGLHYAWRVVRRLSATGQAAR